MVQPSQNSDLHEGNKAFDRDEALVEGESLKKHGDPRRGEISDHLRGSEQDDLGLHNDENIKPRVKANTNREERANSGSPRENAAAQPPYDPLTALGRPIDGEVTSQQSEAGTQLEVDLDDELAQTPDTDVRDNESAKAGEGNKQNEYEVRKRQQNGC